MRPHARITRPVAKRKNQMLVTYSAVVPRKVHGTDVAAGQTLYAVKKGDLFFLCSYADENFARQMGAKLSGPQIGGRSRKLAARRRGIWPQVGA